MGQSKRWIRLGGVNLPVRMHVFYPDWGEPKIAFLQSFHTIKKGRKFQGEVLKENLELRPGLILGCRSDASGKRVWYHVRSLYDLVRSFEHALGSEQRARATAEVSIDTAIELVRDLLAYWPLTLEQRRGLTVRLGGLEDKLKRAQNPDLKDADDAVLDAAGFQDALGRPNPQASMAKIYRARRLITMRLGEITSIVPNLTRLQVVAAQELARIEWVFLERDLNILRAVLKALPRCAQEQHIMRWVVGCLRGVRTTCESIQVAPFYNNAWHMEVEIGSALNILTDQRQTPENRALAAYPIVRTMICSLAFKRAQRELEKIIRELSTRLSAQGGRLTALQSEALAKKVERYAERARQLNEDSFKRKRLSEIQTHLAHAARFLRAGEPKQAKGSLKAASAWL